MAFITFRTTLWFDTAMELIMNGAGATDELVATIFPVRSSGVSLAESRLK